MLWESRKGLLTDYNDTSGVEKSLDLDFMSGYISTMLAEPISPWLQPLPHFTNTICKIQLTSQFITLTFHLIKDIYMCILWRSRHSNYVYYSREINIQRKYLFLENSNGTLEIIHVMIDFDIIILVLVIFINILDNRHTHT